MLCRPPRILTLVGAVAAFALLAAGCGGSPGSHVAQLGSTPAQSGSSANASAASTLRNGAVAFAGCMRANGVSRYPDPGSSAPAKPTLQQLGVGSSRFQAAQNACRHLLPNGGRPPSQAVRLQIREQSLRFSECVRAHGVPNFPDPGSDGRIPDPATVGVDQGSPKFQAANQACGKYRPPYLPSNRTYDAWARTHASG